MDNQFLLQRVINGFYFINYQSKRIKIVTPTAKLRYKTQIYCNSLVDSLRFAEPRDWLSEQKRVQILHYFNIWNQESEEKLDLLNKNQEELKVGLFLGYKNKKNREIFHKKISSNNQEIQTLILAKETFNEYTKQAFIDRLKNYFLIKNTVYMNNKLFLKNEDNFYILQQFLNLIAANNIYDHIPKLIRSSQWLDYWSVSKSRIIRKHVTDWSEEQLFSVNSSIALDSIKKHPECPDSHVLEDTDATEGWILYQNKKDEKEKRKRNIEDNLEGKGKDASEVYVMSNSQQEDKDIYDLNDPMKRRHIKKWQEYVEGQGDKKIDWVDIPAVIEEKKREDRVTT